MKTDFQVYVKGSVEAVELYCRAFGATLGFHEKNPDGTFFHAELTVNGQFLMALSESTNDIWREYNDRYNAKSLPAMQFCVSLDDEESVRKAFDVLKEDANILSPLGSVPWAFLCANLIDKFGVFWYIAKSKPYGPER
jgi:PhnB protein